MPRGSLTSKPTWLNAFGHSTTSAFFVLGDGRPPAGGGRFRAAATVAIGPYRAIIVPQEPLLNAWAVPADGLARSDRARVVLYQGGGRVLPALNVLRNHDSQRYEELHMTPLLIVLIVLGALGLVAATLVNAIYNKLVALRNRFTNAYAQIDVQLKRRYDIVPWEVSTASAAGPTPSRAPGGVSKQGRSWQSRQAPAKSADDHFVEGMSHRR